MPGGDNTGPMGAGPRTGRGLGNCPATPNLNTVYPPRGRGRMMGGGRGMGRGMGCGMGCGMGRARGFAMGWWKRPHNTAAPAATDNQRET